MYENITYEVILQRMLKGVLAKNPHLDTREGSIIFDALALAAIELQNMYIQLDVILNETFADTASREMLIKRGAERGMSLKPATKALFKGEFNIDVPIGSRFSMEDLNCIVIERLGSGVFKLESETVGTVGNENLGTLIPIEYIDGLTTAELVGLLIPGADEEETESFRQRYFASLDSEAFGGNIKDYQEKTVAIPGVGGVKVYPIWNGGGTVKLVIIDSQFNVPSPTLLDLVQTTIDPTENKGEGVGTAPIGHVVNVFPVEALSVNIGTDIVYQEGWTWEDIKPYAEQGIDDYLKELSETWDENDSLVVRISQIEIRLLNIHGILDISGTTINGVAQNLILNADFIPVRGEVNG